MVERRRRGGLWRRVVIAALFVVACGSRTGLFVEEAPPVPIVDSGVANEAGVAVTIADGPADVPVVDVTVEGPLFSCRPRSCTEFGYNCGTNGDGCGGTIECGSCPLPTACGESGFSQCGGGVGLGPDGAPLCTPKTCTDLGFTCGPAADGCGGLLQCGICQYPDECGGAGVPGRCGNTLPCTNLCLQQTACASGTTTVTGTVVTGTEPQFGSPDPVYNAFVYVPNAPVDPFVAGVACNQCGGEVSGQPLVGTQSAPDGTFTLENVPTGANIPLVIQLGRWRRQITIPSVPACTTTALPTELTRLPRTQAEGDIPLTAIATGEADTTECVLMKMGIDISEFTLPSGNGRVQFYVFNGSDLGPNTPQAETLWDNPQALAGYDIVVLPCQGMPETELPSDQQNLVDYTSAGGRLFATHYSYEFLYNDVPFSETASWNPGQMGPNDVTASIDTSFVEGQNFSSWLQTVGALSGPNEINLVNIRDDVDSVVPPTQQFIYAPGQTLQLAFFTPVNESPSEQCGRVVYSDFHVSGNINLLDSGVSSGTTFPSECSMEPLTSQEKALEFMLYDLASCVPAAPTSCTPLTCAQQHITCGPAGDGCGNEVMCGTCTGMDTCGGGGVFGQCGYPDAGSCTPRTCEEQGYNCGENGDGCGGIVQCGTCTLPQICGGGPLPSVCGP